ncbi:MAG TPA: hypothetical protein K8V48_08390 [Limosilactobacillus oris]|uniref:hypothetical protein n=1 Tax=Limosilactobacillus oris TaxID=1632 RepID=UPI001DEA3DFA|nr:hypothetical protein [Limosilactobacillus oris]HJF47964.1 hypothetical protein [Limosilactobacillus oris]
MERVNVSRLSSTERELIKQSLLKDATGNIEELRCTNSLDLVHETIDDLKELESLLKGAAMLWKN